MLQFQRVWATAGLSVHEPVGYGFLGQLCKMPAGVYSDVNFPLLGYQNNITAVVIYMCMYEISILFTRLRNIVHLIRDMYLSWIKTQKYQTEDVANSKTCSVDKEQLYFRCSFAYSMGFSQNSLFKMYRLKWPRMNNFDSNIYRK